MIEYCVNINLTRCNYTSFALDSHEISVPFFEHNNTFIAFRQFSHKCLRTTAHHFTPDRHMTQNNLGELFDVLDVYMVTSWVYT